MDSVNQRTGQEAQSAQLPRRYEYTNKALTNSSQGLGQNTEPQNQPRKMDYFNEYRKSEITTPQAETRR